VPKKSTRFWFGKRWSRIGLISHRNTIKSWSSNPLVRITSALLWDAEVWCVQTRPLRTVLLIYGDSVSSFRLNWQPEWQCTARVSNKKQEFSVRNHVDTESGD
jgi:hypothetical protein